jgi:hypothetical protein
MRKVEIEVPENVYRCLEAFGKFTGQTVRELIEPHVSVATDHILNMWPTGIFGVEVEDLQRRYKL